MGSALGPKLFTPELELVGLFGVGVSLLAFGFSLRAFGSTFGCCCCCARRRPPQDPTTTMPALADPTPAAQC